MNALPDDGLNVVAGGALAMLVWLVPTIEPPPASPKASGAVGTVNPAGPAIVGAFARMLVPTFGPEL